MRHLAPSTYPASRRARGPILLASLALACGSGSDALEDHQALWAKNGPPSYQYTFATSGFAPPANLRVTVTDRVVTSTVPVGDNLPSPVGKTMEELFADAAQQLTTDCKVTVHYDETLGYPLSLYSDCGIEGAGWTVSDFAPLP
jgi:hypothetical protein